MLLVWMRLVVRMLMMRVLTSHDYDDTDHDPDDDADDDNGTHVSLKVGPQRHPTFWETYF